MAEEKKQNELFTIEKKHISLGIVMVIAIVVGLFAYNSIVKPVGETVTETVKEAPAKAKELTTDTMLQRKIDNADLSDAKDPEAVEKATLTEENLRELKEKFTEKELAEGHFVWSEHTHAYLFAADGTGQNASIEP